VHALEIPIAIGERKLLIHCVLAGETFEMLAQTYTTTSEVIRALNPSLNPPLLANRAIVISPGLQSIDPALPAFQAYEVTEAEITIDELAQKLEVDSMLLRNFNACPDNCRLAAGDWLIITIPKQ
jgi:LysM repeat protein